MNIINIPTTHLHITPPYKNCKSVIYMDGPPGLQPRLKFLPVSQRVGELLHADTQGGELVSVNRGRGGQGVDCLCK